MKHHVRIAVAALFAAVVVGSAAAQAQTAEFEIGFGFMAGGKSMPAGKYVITANGALPVIVKGAGTMMTMEVITQLGRHDTDAEPELVFDKLGTVLHLSEVWMPGKDGQLLLGTKEMHDHTVLRVSKPVK